MRLLAQGLEEGGVRGVGDVCQPVLHGASASGEGLGGEANHGDHSEATVLDLPGLHDGHLFQILSQVSKQGTLSQSTSQR